jgi:cytidyltransferase-like protein
MQSKIQFYEKQKNLKMSLRGPKSVLVGGCFDLLHYGHLKFLQAAKSSGDDLVVALESDDNIVKVKKINPIHKQHQRAEILAELMCVDKVLLLPPLNGYEDYRELVSSVNPKILAVTSGDIQLANKQKQAAEIGATVVIVNQLIEGLSSYIIRSKLLD